MLCVVTEDTERVDGQRRLGMLRGLASNASAMPDEAEVLAATAAALGDDLRLVPFSAGYLFEPDRSVAHLAWTSGTSEGSPVAPSVIDDDQGPWPASAVRAGQATVVDLDPGVLGPLPLGAWSEPPTRAIVEPLAAAGSEQPYGFVVLGVNRYRPLDEGYRSFARLIAGQVAAAISAARSWEAERRRAEQLAELDAAKTAFFTNVSHELRTPLTLIIGPVADALADRRDPLSDGQRRRLGIVERNADRLLALVNTLLDFSRLQAGRAVGRYQPTDLAAETSQLCAMFGSAMDDAGLRFDLQVEPLGEPVYIDREMWAKVVVNLLSNALKFTLEGGITVTLRPVEGGAEIAVTDTGEGIGPDDQTHLFERFHRVAGVRARSHEGSGIGLALVAELVALHGGDVSVTSTLGEGSTFRVRLPFGAAHLPPDQVETADPDRPAERGADRGRSRSLAEIGTWSGAIDGAGQRPGPADDRSTSEDEGTPKVLVADDNADMRDYVTGLLASRYRVQVAVDGADALDKAMTDPPALVLTDVMMPNMDGFDLLRALRSNPVTAAVPVVFLSARAGEEGVVEGLEAGADDYLAKPFAAPELLARVKANLELDRSRQARAVLQRSQDLVDQAQQLARVGSWEYDAVSGAVTCSDEHLRLLGATRAELEAAGRDALLAQAAAPEDRRAVTDAFDRALVDHRPFGFDARFVSPDGHRWWGRVRGTVVTDADGAAIAVRGSLQDITDQREAEQQRAAAAATEEAAARERSIADELQAALLPTVGVDPAGLDVATYYRPGAAGTHVGGDWYDLIDLGDDRTALVLGDVMGRGVQAAAIMGQLRTVVRAYARLGLSPTQILEALDGHVRDLGEEHIVTCVYAVYDPAAQTLTWANAGHLPPLVVEPGQPTTVLDGNAPPLGTGPLTVPQLERSLPAGALLALYTDGLVERRGQDLTAGVAHLAELLGGVDRYLPAGPQRLVEAMLPDGPDDDVAILLARVHDPGDRPAHSWAYQLNADPAAVTIARRAAMTVLATWELPSDVTDQVAVIISELATNAILHGQPPFDLDVTKHGQDLLITVTDTAPAGPQRLRPTSEDEHGRGLQLVDALSTQWGTRVIPGGKTVWASLALPAPERARR